MKNLRRDFERFCYRHQNIGIPNLMLWLSIGAAIIMVLFHIDPSNVVYRALCFDLDQIRGGQVWRLLTYILIPTSMDFFYLAVSLFLYYILGRELERSWGTFRFNLFYFSGVLIMDVAALILGVDADVSYLNLSLFLAYATKYPNQQIWVSFLFPVKMKFLAWLYFGYTAFQLITYPFPYNIFPLFAILNYFLFFGADIVDVLPGMIRTHAAQGLQPLRRRRPEAAEAQPQLGQAIHPEKAPGTGLPPQVYRLRSDRRQQSGIGVPLLLQVQRLPLLLHGPYQ